MRKILGIIFTSLLISSSVLAHEHVPLKEIVWPFDGAFGTIDRQAAQRGFQVYKEVCSACHNLAHLSYRNLKDIGITDAEIKEIAKEKMVTDGPNSQGEMFQRPASPSDRFVGPFANEEAARAANGGALPVDLSLIIKAREDGANYVHSLLTGFENAPPGAAPVPNGLYYNQYFPGNHIAMPPPLSDGQVQFRDGTVASIDQMSRDVVVFLQWAAEPEMERRKAMGLRTVIYLLIFTALFYVVKLRIWSKLK